MKTIIFFGLLSTAYICAQDTLKVERIRTVKDTVYIIQPDTTAIIARHKKEYDKNVEEMLFYINEAILEYLKRKPN